MGNEPNTATSGGKQRGQYVVPHKKRPGYFARTAPKDPVPKPGAFKPVFNSFMAIEGGFSLHPNIGDLMCEEGVEEILEEDSDKKYFQQALSASALAIKVGEHFDLFDDEQEECLAPLFTVDGISEIGKCTTDDGVELSFVDKETTAHSLTVLADQILTYETEMKGESLLWTPRIPGDKRTKQVVSQYLYEYFQDNCVPVTVTEVEKYIFSGQHPPWYNHVRQGFDAARSQCLMSLFKHYRTHVDFANIIFEVTVELLQEIGLPVCSRLNLPPFASDYKELLIHSYRTALCGYLRYLSPDGYGLAPVAKTGKMSQFTRVSKEYGGVNRIYKYRNEQPWFSDLVIFRVPDTDVQPNWRHRWSVDYALSGTMCREDRRPNFYVPYYDRAALEWYEVALDKATV